MALSTCADCSTAYAVGLAACPHCGSTDRKGSGSVLPWLDVACPAEQCPHAGQVRRVHLRQVVPGVVEIPHLLLCARCGAAMPAVAAQIGPIPVPITGLEEIMPKITRHGGPTNKADEQPVSAPAAEPEATPEQVAGEEESSPGSSSETSSPKAESSPETSDPGPQKPARTTGSRSRKGRGASSTAGSAGGSGNAE